MKMQHKFVEFVPESVQPNTLYVSLEYGTAVHKCCCGCGEEVVTPLSPSDWKLIFDGESVSLMPSIGNWSFNCRSHYFIKNSNVAWCNDTGVAKVRPVKQPIEAESTKPTFVQQIKSWWSKLWN
ncbi:DUF6527 family protein [Pseudoalteromonas ruthenica]|nr:DUF6527 family protein [Pseudoalteromonas ruthenica]